MSTRLLLCCLAFASAAAQAVISPEAARKILEANRDALVTVNGVLKAEMFVDGSRSGPEREVPMNVSGFIVDPSGLVVVSRFHLDPVGSMMRKPIRVERDGRSMEFEMRSRLENLRLRWHDRSEVAARIVLEDADLGLILLGPEPKEGLAPREFKAVRVEDAVIPGPFTQYLVVDQGEATFRNEAVLETGTISGLLTKPRSLYLQDLGRPWMFVGAPFFDLEGKFLGMGLLHVRPPQDPSAGLSETSPSPVIVPATDIRDLVERALKKGAGPQPAPAKEASKDRLAELPTERALAILNAASNAVVVIEGSLRYKCGRCAEEHEGEMEAVGTVLDPSGLVVVASDGESSGNQYLEQHLRCVLADGSEIPFQILRHDDDLLLTVLGPASTVEAPGEVFKPLRLAPEVKAELLDDVVALGRLGKENRYTLSVSVGHITARTTQPRLFYQLYSTPPSVSESGFPVLTGDGALLGITAPDPQIESRGEEDGEAGANPLSGQFSPSRIVPVAALVELLEHAREARAKPGESARN